jgi:hypothetical protein
MRTVLLGLCLLTSALAGACGASSSAGRENAGTPAAVSTEKGPAPAGAPGRLVLVDATLDRQTYVLGEAVRVRRVYRNVGEAPVRMTPKAWQDRRYAEAVLHSKGGSRLYRPDVGHLEEIVVEPGGQTEHRICVELGGPGSYRIEVPPAYHVRGGTDPCFQLPALVLDRTDDRVLAEKAERLARVIEREDPGCPTCWTEAQGSLQAMGAAAVPHLRRWLRESASDHLRAVAAKLLHCKGGEAGIEELVAGLADPVPDVRRMCARSLGALRHPHTLDALLPMLKDPDVWVRVDAVEEIAHFDDPRVLPAMRGALADEDPYARQNAAYHLACDRKDAAGIEVLIEALCNDEFGDCWMAVTALEALTDLSFGEATLPMSLSGFDQRDRAVEQNRRVARAWLAWWEEEGRERFGR